MQWHPLFAKMLRPIVQEHFDVETNVPVGDVPRSADIVLLRRLSDRPTPFHGLWHHLTTWNILEFKGRSVSARIRHLDLLVELGLGIDRRLNGERTRQKLPPLHPADVSLWYIANHLGRRFLHEARQRLGNLEAVSPGVWRSQVLFRPLFLIDGRNVPIERDSVPLHLAGEESDAIDQELARVIVEEPGYWELFGPLLGALHPNIYEEANRMARAKGKRGDLDLRPWVAIVGLGKILEGIEVGEVIATLDPKKVARELDMEKYLANLTAEQRRRLKDLLK